MNCPRACAHGYVGTDEIPTYGAPVTAGRIGLHLEFKARMNEPTRVKLCRCQTDPHGEAEASRRSRAAWRLEET